MIHKVFIEREGQSVAQVTFTVPNALWVDRLYLVGDFNEWQYTTYPMTHDERAGHWREFCRRDQVKI